MTWNFIPDLETISKDEMKMAPETRKALRRLPWCPPPQGFGQDQCKWAVGRAGDRGAFSVICWDRNRTYLGSSLVTFNYITYVPTLEALACSEAHALASDIFVRNVLIFI